MTLDKKTDRPSTPLASVSDPIHPENLDPISRQQGDIADPAAPECSEEAPAPTNAFEGFGSFS